MNFVSKISAGTLVRLRLSKLQMTTPMCNVYASALGKTQRFKPDNKPREKSPCGRRFTRNHHPKSGQNAEDRKSRCLNRGLYAETVERSYQTFLWR